MFGTIVLAVDGSEHSRLALRNLEIALASRHARERLPGAALIRD